jgi:dissimilatory sulfite reductase (desulfoviridin) alpha/beta subunit
MKNEENKLNPEELRRGGIVQIQGDNLYSVWIKILCNNATAAQLRKIADIADNFGRGIILFSTRQIPIVPFIKLDNISDVKRLLAETQLTFEACGPRIRGIDVCYDRNICPFSKADALSLGEKLDKFFHMTNVMFKIKISVSGCAIGCTVPRILSDVGFVGVRHNGASAYDVYIGGRLGLKPFVGEKAAENLTEDQCVILVQNTVHLIETEGVRGERLADIIARRGVSYVIEKVKARVNSQTSDSSAVCLTKLNDPEHEKIIVRIKSLCGEVSSAQARKIADIAEKYGRGFVHFDIWGAPEIPCVDPRNIEALSNEIKESGLKLLSGFVDNAQSCFGNYCTKTSADVQSLLKRVFAFIEKTGLNDLPFRISGAGCTNSCGIPHLADIGFIGWLKPKLISKNCTGCELCVGACKVKAIEMKNKKAVIDESTCRYCGECSRLCPFDAIQEEKKGITVLAGGQAAGCRWTFQQGKTIADNKLGIPVAEFLSEDGAYEVAKKLFLLMKEKKRNLSDIINEIGLEGLKKSLEKGSTNK